MVFSGELPDLAENRTTVSRVSNGLKRGKAHSAGPNAWNKRALEHSACHGLQVLSPDCWDYRIPCRPRSFQSTPQAGPSGHVCVWRPVRTSQDPQHRQHRRKAPTHPAQHPQGRTFGRSGLVHYLAALCPCAAAWFCRKPSIASYPETASSSAKAPSQED